MKEKVEKTAFQITFCKRQLHKDRLSKQRHYHANSVAHRVHIYLNRSQKDCDDLAFMDSSCFADIFEERHTGHRFYSVFPAIIKIRHCDRVIFRRFATDNRIHGMGKEYVALTYNSLNALCSKGKNLNSIDKVEMSPACKLRCVAYHHRFVAWFTTSLAIISIIISLI